MKRRSYWFILALAGGCAGTGPDSATTTTATSAPVPAATARPRAPGAAEVQPAPAAAQKDLSAQGSFRCGSLTIPFGPTVPADSHIGNQTDADCFAWQEFIALNWPASGGSFGAPGDVSDVAWQGYMSTHQLFQPDAAAPPPWGTPPQIIPECKVEARLDDAQALQLHPLVNATKFSGQILDASDTAEAFPEHGAPAWIGDVNGNNVWFEVRVNRDEYDYVVQNQFYNADKQLAFYKSQNPVRVPLQLPAGCIGPSPTCAQTTTGAIELKAAWMEVPNPGDPKWNSYKLSKAVVVDPKTSKCEQVTVALVALHIIHKTQTQPTWIWATFEHKDNAPDAGVPGGGPWNFNNPSCSAKTVQVPTDCQYQGQASVTTTCSSNTPPQYHIGAGCPAPTPTQVTRVNPIDTTAKTVNDTVHEAIQSAWRESVWQNYVLVNVVWSSNAPSVPSFQPGSCKAGSPGCQRVTAPQLTQSMNPSGAVANTVLETYVQQKSPVSDYGKSNCIACHVNAQVPNAKDERYAADFSFALEDAQSPPGALKARSTRPREHRRIRRIFR